MNHFSYPYSLEDILLEVCSPYRPLYEVFYICIESLLDRFRSPCPFFPHFKKKRTSFSVVRLVPPDRRFYCSLLLSLFFILPREG